MDNVTNYHESVNYQQKLSQHTTGLQEVCYKIMYTVIGQCNKTVDVLHAGSKRDGPVFLSNLHILNFGHYQCQNFVNKRNKHILLPMSTTFHHLKCFGKAKIAIKRNVPVGGTHWSDTVTLH